MADNFLLEDSPVYSPLEDVLSSSSSGRWGNFNESNAAQTIRIPHRWNAVW
jgi:hypothetical protein